jgi:hypothetical protein
VDQKARQIDKPLQALVEPGVPAATMSRVPRQAAGADAQGGTPIDHTHLPLSVLARQNTSGHQVKIRWLDIAGDCLAAQPKADQLLSTPGQKPPADRWVNGFDLGFRIGLLV